MITDELKKQVLESLIQELDMHEVDGMGKDPDATATGSDDACPYCDESCAMDNPKCSMHEMHKKQGLEPPKPKMKIKIGGNPSKKEGMY